MAAENDCTDKIDYSYRYFHTVRPYAPYSVEGRGKRAAISPSSAQRKGSARVEYRNRIGINDSQGPSWRQDRLSVR